MMKKAGYLRRSRHITKDYEGHEFWILELVIRGKRFALRTVEVRQALAGSFPARLEYLHQNWGQYTEGLAGYASLSHSRRALNISLSSGEGYTISVQSVQRALASPDYFASVASIKTKPTNHQISGKNQTRSALAKA